MNNGWWMILSFIALCFLMGPGFAIGVVLTVIAVYLWIQLMIWRWNKDKDASG
jgi:hypothetical protein